MAIFRFKQFEVRNERSAMKVNTDGVLLGALMTLRPDTDRRLLDIGTGTGAIALMAAQRLLNRSAKSPSPKESEAHLKESAEEKVVAWYKEAGEAPVRIDAIDIDEASAEEAALNFAASPWAASLRARRTSLQDFAPEAAYDAIFSNPPFFTETLHSPDSRKAQARHADSLPLGEIFRFAARNLAPGGRLSLILPASQETPARREAACEGLGVTRIVSIKGSERKPPYRAVIEFSRSGGQIVEPLRENVTINMNGKYSDQYLTIVTDFLLIQNKA